MKKPFTNESQPQQDRKTWSRGQGGGVRGCKGALRQKRMMILAGTVTPHNTKRHLATIQTWVLSFIMLKNGT